MRSISELRILYADGGVVENVGDIRTCSEAEGSFTFEIGSYDTLYEDENRIGEGFGGRTILKKDSSRNFESLLSSITEKGGEIKINVNEELYNKNPRKFAREFYRMIENQPTGFETEKEPSILSLIHISEPTRPY